MKQVFRYDKGATRLEVEGIADSSLGQNEDSIGILFNWKLNIIGRPQLEGKKEHIQCFMNVVLQYSRYRLSGLKKSFGSDTDFVTISPDQPLHKLLLRSGQNNVEPMSILLDDAELADLTRCFDFLRNDPRVHIKWGVNEDRRLGIIELFNLGRFSKRLLSPVIGLLSITLTSFLFLLIPNTSYEVPTEDQNHKVQNLPTKL
ncbi:DUF4335 domain-containing protein [Prochlorococcus marinus]|uniref:DUF4335 domain-containing protein n=1 Tax=Prochlorococcus marinus TaxID=1219 RepID=UPI0022B53C54|nr:DUF4335 domain-containing protein [Prochlorococcus marinus]